LDLCMVPPSSEVHGLAIATFAEPTLQNIWWQLQNKCCFPMYLWDAPIIEICAICHWAV
jgi:hypothetical protein